ncbi:MAG: hypothetical protein IKH33_03410 [Bacteroidales bacterium]|nr:hypothetical protein [Bacteroidales bacterium]
MDQHITCPVCGQTHSSSICPTCGFENRQMLVSTPNPVIQQIDAQRIKIAKRNWELINNSKEQIDTLTENNCKAQEKITKLEQQISNFKTQIERQNAIAEENVGLRNQIIEKQQQLDSVSVERERLSNEKTQLEKLIEEMKATQEGSSQTPSFPNTNDNKTPLAYMVVYVGGTEANSLNDIHPIYYGDTYVGKGTIDIPQGSQRCKLQTGDPEVKKNHFIIKAVQNPTTNTFTLKATLQEGDWNHNYMGHKPHEISLQHDDRIIIGQVTIIIKKK